MSHKVWFLVLFTFVVCIDLYSCGKLKKLKNNDSRSAVNTSEQESLNNEPKDLVVPAAAGEGNSPVDTEVNSSLIADSSRIIKNVADIIPKETQETNSGTRKIIPTASPVRYDGAQTFRIHVTNSKSRKRVNDLIEKGVVEKWGSNGTYVDIMVKQDKVTSVKHYLEKAKLTYEVMLEDLQKAIDEENPEITEEELAVLTGRKGHRMTFHKYHRMEDIYGYLDYLAQTYPQLVTLTDIGKSLEGRPLRLVKVSSDVPNSKSFWIDGGIHAREWITPATAVYILSELVENREAQDGYLRKVNFYILPITNPDGYEYSHIIDRLWRKNRRKSPKGDACSGIDLNRNWGFHWGGLGSGKEQCQAIYAGPAPFSEPETKAVSQFIMANRASMKAFVTFHSYGQYILYPWGYNRKVPPDYQDLERVGRAAASAMLKIGGSAYTVGNSAQLLYPASGAADDWAKGVPKIKYTYTIELRDKGKYGFVLPASHILPVGKESFAAIKVIAYEIYSLKE